MKKLLLALVFLACLRAREPLVQRIVHTDPAKYRPSKAVHDGAGQSLTSLPLPATTVTLAAVVDAATWPVRISGMPGSHPPFCRVAATLKPSDDSDIKIEVWMPTTGWNGNFEAVGNGGWSGAIGYAAMAAALKAGYATASTDTGHEGGSASFALGHPKKLIDFAYRSEHEMTVKAKAIVQAFYGKTQTHSY